MDFTPDAYALADSLACNVLYVKMLDVGKNAASGEIEPYSRTALTDSAALRKYEIVPTVFLTNEVFQGISRENSKWLAGKIAKSLKLPVPAKEYLFDCDWTPSTRDAFFQFLKQMRSELPKNARLSATIRLHQYKFPEKTGTPPVDRGMLMFYNTGDVDLEGERNTIFHPDDALKYVDGAPANYPLPLDLALPLFSWGLVFREGELWKIIPGPLPIEAMRQSGKYTETTDSSPFASRLWELREGTFLGGHYLRPGDHLRVSTCPPELLFESARLARKLDLAPDARLAFFHLGIARSEGFSAQLLDSLCKTR